MSKTKLGALGLGILAVVIGALVAFGPLGVGAGHTERTKMEVRLSATDADPLASGKAKWEQRLEEDGVTIERQRTSTEVEDLATIGAHEVKISRDTDSDGSFETTVSAGEMFVEVDALGFGDLDLDSRDGDTVPDMEVGDLVEVLDPDSTVILTGTLQLKE